MEKTAISLLSGVLLLLAIPSNVAAQSSADTLQARVHLARATEMLGTASLEEALSSAELAVVSNAGVSSGIDLEAANLMEDIGLAYFKARNMQAVVLAFEKALEVFKNTELRQSLKVARLHNNLGIALRSLWELKRALYHFETSLAIRLELQKEPNIDIAKSHNNIGVVLSDLGRNREALEQYLKSLEIKRSLLEVDSLDIAKTLGNIGGLYGDMKNTVAAFESLEQAFELIKNRTDHEALAMLANYFNNVAGIYNYRRDYYKAIQFHEQAIKLKKQIYGDEAIETLNSYENLSSVHMEINDYDQALALLSESERIIEENGLTNSLSSGTTLYRIGTIYAQQGRTTEARQYLDKAQAIFIEVLTENNSFSAKYYETMGQLFRSEGDFSSALASYNQKLKIEKAISEGLLHSEILNTLLLIAAAYQEAGNPREAMRYIDETLELIKQYPENNPEVRYSYFEALLLKAEQLSTEDPAQAQQYFEEALATSEKFRDDLEDKYSKAEFLAMTRRVADGLIKLYMNSSAASEAARRQAFVVAEKTKGFLLQEGFREAHALSYSNLPKELLAKEAGLRQDIGYYEVQLYLERSAAEPDERMMYLYNEKLIQLNRDYLAFKKRLEDDHEEYYKLRYDRQVQSVTDIQNPSFLSPDQSLLEYYVGDSTIYAFVIRPDTFAVVAIRKDFDIEALVAQLREGLYGYHSTQNRPDTLYGHTAKLYSYAAHQLYGRLVAPVQALLPSRVVVVPDGVLGYVPFEALLTEKPARPDRFHEHRYLGKEYIISYAYSATLLREMRQKRHRKQPTGSVLAMAPFFNGDVHKLSEAIASGEALPALRNDTLTVLSHSGEEALRIAREYQGKSLIGKEATKAAFEREAADYRILHLSTHGVADDRVGDYAWLSFARTGDVSQFEKLYVRDVYNLCLNADLVVLSSCQAGIGKLQRGEGIISLSRAFAYAGAKGIVTTLWAVDDEKTKDFMLAFYGHLRKMPAAEALWQTRLDFLTKSTGEAAHPYFWAGFIGVGDM